MFRSSSSSEIDGLDSDSSIPVDAAEDVSQCAEEATQIEIGDGIERISTKEMFGLSARLCEDAHSLGVEFFRKLRADKNMRVAKKGVLKDLVIPLLN